MRIGVKELGALIVTSSYLPTESGVMVSAVADLGDLYVGAGVSVIDVLETGGIRDAWNWTGVENIEFAAMARAALSNGMRLVGVLGYFAPAAFEPLYYRRARSISLMPDPTETHSGTPAAVGTAPWAHRCGEKGKRIKHAGIFVIGVLSILYIGVILFFRGNDAWALLRAGNLNELGDFLAGLSAPIAFGWYTDIFCNRKNSISSARTRGTGPYTRLTRQADRLVARASSSRSRGFYTAPDPTT